MELENCVDQSWLFVVQARLSDHTPPKVDNFNEMFSRHHSPSPDCGYYHKVLQEFCKAKVLFLFIFFVFFGFQLSAGG